MSTVAQNSSMAVMANGVKLVGETMLPGASLLLDGEVKNGAAHAVIGLGARVLLGPVGFAIVAADSFAKSVSGKNLSQHASEIYQQTREAFQARREAKAAKAAEACTEEAASATVIEAVVEPTNTDK